MFLKLLTIRCRLVYFSLIDQNETFLYTNFSLTRVFKRVTRVYTRPIRTRVKRIYKLSLCDQDVSWTSLLVSFREICEHLARWLSKGLFLSWFFTRGTGATFVTRASLAPVTQMPPFACPSLREAKAKITVPGLISIHRSVKVCALEMVLPESESIDRFEFFFFFF